MSVNIKKNALTINELRKALANPSPYSATHKKTAILRFYSSYSFIEYPRKEINQVFNELEKRVALLQTGLEEPTATDRFLLTVLKTMAGDV